jgi:hypothetical protein
MPELVRSGARRRRAELPSLPAEPS